MLTLGWPSLDLKTMRSAPLLPVDLYDPLGLGAREFLGLGPLEFLGLGPLEFLGLGPLLPPSFLGLGPLLPPGEGWR